MSSSRKSHTVALVLHNYTSQTDTEISLVKGQTVKVYDKFENGWWVGKNDEGRRGVFPGSYVTEKFDNLKVEAEKVPKQRILSTTIQTKPTILFKAKVIYDYNASSDKELSIKKEDVVSVYKKIQEDGWWLGELNGNIGHFPAKYVIELPLEPVVEAEPTTENEPKNLEENQENSTKIEETKNPIEEEKLPENKIDVEEQKIEEKQIKKDLEIGIAIHDYKTDETDHINFSKGDFILIIEDEQIQIEYWKKGKFGDKIGIFPVQYVKQYNFDKLKAKISAGQTAIALYEFDALDPTELNLKKGDLIEILESNDPNSWWKGKINNAIGHFPGNYVRIITPESLEQISAAEEKNENRSNQLPENFNKNSMNNINENHKPNEILPVTPSRARKVSQPSNDFAKPSSENQEKPSRTTYRSKSNSENSNSETSGLSAPATPVIDEILSIPQPIPAENFQEPKNEEASKKTDKEKRVKKNHKKSHKRSASTAHKEEKTGSQILDASQSSKDFDSHKKSLTKHFQNLSIQSPESNENNQANTSSLIKPEELKKEYVALYSYSSPKAGVLSLAPGDTVKVINKLPSGWWKGEINGKFGMVPGSYLRERAIKENSERKPPSPSPSRKLIKVRAKYDFKGKSKSELSFNKGDVFYQIDATVLGSGWVRGQFNDRRGFFPPSFVELVESQPSLNSFSTPMKSDSMDFSSTTLSTQFDDSSSDSEESSNSEPILSVEHLYSMIKQLQIQYQTAHYKNTKDLLGQLQKSESIRARQEEQLRGLTGRVEQLTIKLDKQEDTINKQQKLIKKLQTSQPQASGSQKSKRRANPDEVEQLREIIQTEGRQRRDLESLTRKLESQNEVLTRQVNRLQRTIDEQHTQEQIGIGRLRPTGRDLTH